MSDDIERLFDELGGSRPLPPRLRARLEAALTAGVEAGAAADHVADLPGVDGPRAMPLPTRVRVERAVMRATRRPGRPHAVWAVAALVLAALAPALLLNRDGGEGSVETAAPLPTTVSPEGGDAGAVSDGGLAGDVGTQTSGGSSGAGAAAGSTADGLRGADAGSGASAGGAAASPPPPVAESGQDAAPVAAPATALAGIEVGVITGDPQAEAAFRAYVRRVNEGGGVGGRSIVLRDVGPELPPGVAAVVNLSRGPSAPLGEIPLLESLFPVERTLAGWTFSFSSAAERQAHVLADAVFPRPAPGATAAIVRSTSGVLHDTVPPAIEKVLRAREVGVVQVTVDRTRPVLPPGVDVVFLSLEPEDAAAWLRAARAAGYRPRLGVAGVATLYDDALRSELVAGTRIVSPYRPPSGDEADVLRAIGGGSVSARLLHGWATAKGLVAALERAQADPDRAGVRAALAASTGFESGLAPPYAVREGTNSRTPEAAVLTVGSAGFAWDGAFRRDSF